MTYEIEFWAIPPSLNHGGAGARQHWSVGARAKKQWQNTFAFLLMECGLPRDLARVHVLTELHFKDHRRRDADNYYSSISKPLADAMVQGGWLPDDGPEHYAMDIRLLKGQPETKLLLKLTVDPSAPAPAARP